MDESKKLWGEVFGLYPTGNKEQSSIQAIFISKNCVSFWVYSDEQNKHHANPYGTSSLDKNIETYEQKGDGESKDLSLQPNSTTHRKSFNL